MKNNVFTSKSFWATAVVLSHSIDADTTIFTWGRPTFIPICLALYARVAIYTVTGICTEKKNINKINEKKKTVFMT